MWISKSDLVFLIIKTTRVTHKRNPGAVDLEHERSFGSVEVLPAAVSAITAQREDRTDEPPNSPKDFPYQAIPPC